MILDSKIPSGPIERQWDSHRFALKLVNPANKRKYHLIVVGTGLAGASAAAAASGTAAACAWSSVLGLAASSAAYAVARKRRT